MNVFWGNSRARRGWRPAFFCASLSLVLLPLCCVGGGNNLVAAGPTPSTQPAPPGPSSPATQSPEQQAQGQLAANLAAQVQAMIEAKGIEYSSEFGWKPAICVLASQGGSYVLIAYMLLLSHRRELARIAAGKGRLL